MDRTPIIGQYDYISKLPPDIRRKVLLELPDEELIGLCGSNRTYRNTCNNDTTFWNERILTQFPVLTPQMANHYSFGREWHDYYIELTRIRRNPNDYMWNAIELDRHDQVLVALSSPSAIAVNFNNEIMNDSSPEITETIALYLLRGVGIKSVCTGLYGKLKAKYVEMFGEDYGHYLITVLFNPDLGLIPINSLEQDRWDVVGGPWERNPSPEGGNLHKLVRAAELIHAKIETPNIFPGFYNDYIEDTPGLEQLVTNNIEVTPAERQTVLRAFKDLAANHEMIRGRFRVFPLTKEESLLTLLIYTWYRMGRYPLETKWVDVCAALSNPK